MIVPTEPGDQGTSAEAERIDALVARDVTGAGAADFWLRHLQAGLVLFGAATVLAAVYLYLTPDGPHRGIEWVMVAVSATATSVVIALPRRAIARSPRRLVFFVSWSSFTCVFVGAVAALDNGLRSPLALMLLIPTTYASLAYPARAVVGIGALAAVSATGAAAVAGNTLAETEVFVGTIGMVTLLCASVTQARSEQQAARHDLTERLVQLATHDSLTGCLNHRTFYEQLASELARAVRHGHAVSLLVLDVDDFKSINDTWGHLAGDEVLRGIGSVLNQSGRGTDAVGRIGGDEFAVLLLETTCAQAEEAAARFRAAVADMGGPVRVTVTVGVAHVDQPTVDTIPQRLVATADARLYELKHQMARGVPPSQLMR